MFQTRKIKILHIKFDNKILIATGSWREAARQAGVPDDVGIVMTQKDFRYGHHNVYLAHPDFEMIPEDSEIPVWSKPTKKEKKQNV